MKVTPVKTTADFKVLDESYQSPTILVALWWQKQTQKQSRFGLFRADSNKFASQLYIKLWDSYTKAFIGQFSGKAVYSFLAFCYVCDGFTWNSSQNQSYTCWYNVCSAPSLSPYMHLYITRSQIKRKCNEKEYRYCRADHVLICGLWVMQSVHGSEKMLGLACKTKQQVSILVHTKSCFD